MAGKHHTIPQFILKGFTAPMPPNAHPKFEPFAWFYDVPSRRWEKAATKNIAWERGFYHLPDREGAEAEDFERALAEMEGVVSGILRNVIATRQPLEGDDREWVALFVALAVVRTPDFRRFWDNEAQARMDDLIRRARDPDERARLNRRYEATTGRPGITEDDLARIDLDNIRVRPEQGYYLHRMTDGLHERVAFFNSMEWHFLHAHGDDCFVVADTAGAMGAYAKGRQPFDNYDPRTAIFFPVSQRICLHLDWRPSDALHTDAPTARVEGINRLSVFSAVEYLIAPRRSFTGAQYLTERFGRGSRSRPTGL
jgi:hypothetical protein